MRKFKIQLCLLGHQRHLDKIKKLQNYRSKLFHIIECIEIKQLPQSDLDWAYSDSTICNLLSANNVDNTDADLCLCFIDLPIEDNYFTRDLSQFDSKTVLCSFYQAEEIFAAKNVDLFNYVHGIVLNKLVQIATLHRVDEKYFLHDDTRNCLFDMCGIKEDIAIKYSAPNLCTSCISKIESSAVDKNFLLFLNKEFKSFKKMLFYRILDFIKQRPVLAIVMTSIFTIVINVMSSFIYELIKAIIC